MGLIREEGLWSRLVDESKCKIIVSAEAGPEDLFFPDALDDKSRETNEEVMAQEALSDAVAAPFRPNVSSYSEPEQSQLAGGNGSVGGNIGGRQGDAARMFKRRERSHPSEETTPAFKTLSIFTGGSPARSGVFGYVTCADEEPFDGCCGGFQARMSGLHT
jgi:hypothetical protein